MVTRVPQEIQGWQIYLLVGLGLLLHSPSLTLGFFADDYVHQGVLDRQFVHPRLRPWNLFDFGGIEDFQDLSRNEGAVPWWTEQGWRVRFLRPLSSLSIWLDHSLYGDWSVGYHLTSLLLFGLLIRLLYPLYRSWGLSPRAAGASILVFVCLDDNLTPVGWSANRNSLLATLFLVGTALLMDRARRGSGWALPAALLASLAASLSKESGVVGFIIIAACLVWHSGTFQSSLAPLAYRLGLALSLALPLFYVAVLTAGDYGTRSLFYATPWDSPLRFLEHLGTLLATVWTNLVMPFPLDALNFFPDQFWWLFWVATVPGLVLLVPIVSRVHTEWPRLVPGGLWLLLTLVPQGVPPVSNRLFILPLVGGATLLGVFLAQERDSAPLTGRRRTCFFLVFVLSVPLSGMATVVQGLSLSSMAEMVRTGVAGIAAEAGPDGSHIVVLQSPYSIMGFASIWTYHGETGDYSRRFWLMQTGREELVWTRIDDNSYLLESPAAGMLRSPFEQLFRTRQPWLSPGPTYEDTFLAVETVASGSRGVRKVKVRLRRSLDDPSVVFLRAVGDSWKRILPPAPGESTVLPAPQVSTPFLP